MHFLSMILTKKSKHLNVEGRDGHSSHQKVMKQVVHQVSMHRTYVTTEAMTTAYHTFSTKITYVTTRERVVIN